MTEISLSLLVIRVANLDRSAAFYSALGLSLKRESHGSGPEHLAAELGPMVFELYPASVKFPISASARIGFAVASMETVFKGIVAQGAQVLTEPKGSAWGLRAVVVDPDGHRVELTERPTASGQPVMSGS